MLQQIRPSQSLAGSLYEISAHNENKNNEFNELFLFDKIILSFIHYYTHLVGWLVGGSARHKNKNSRGLEIKT